MKSFVSPKAGTRLLRLLVVTLLTISVVFSFAPMASAQTPVSSIFNTAKPKVAHILPIESDRYQINITGTNDVFISVGNEVIDLSDQDTEWPSVFSEASIYPNEDSGYSISLATGQDYDLAFVSDQDPINLSVYRVDEAGATVEVVKYCNCSWTTIVAAQIQITSEGIGDLYYDKNGDGKLDTRVKPNVRDENPNGVDLESPDVFAEEQYVNGELKLFLRARDNDKVSRIQYYYGAPIVNVDGTYIEKEQVDQIGQDGEQELVATQTYKNPIKITDENKNKTVFITAFDRVGNQSNWTQYTIGSIIPSINNTPLPKGVHTGDVIKFVDDPLFYLVAEEDDWTSTGGLIPFETTRMLNFIISSDGFYGGKTITYSQEDPRLYTRYVYSTVEKLSTDYVFYCKDHSYENISLVADEGTVYLVNGCTKRAFANPEALTGLGYSMKNIVNGDLDQYGLKSLSPISSKDDAHPLGSWVNYQGTIYYAHSEGMIPVPSMSILTSNNGKLSYVLPASSGDVAEIALSGSETDLMVEQDARISIQHIFGSTPEDIDNEKPIAQRRDEKRYTDAATINWALYNYYNDHKKLPDYLAQLIPDYLDAIPQAPLPADGICTQDQNNYTYERLSDDNYNLHYCYGTPLYDSYSAGPQSSSYLGLQ